MVLEEASPRISLPVGLLALVPVAWYGLGSSLVAAAVSAVNVVFILGCLYVAFGPVDGHHEPEPRSSGTS
ncbi:cytochrome-ba3 oxidase subunit [Natrialba swarupiae]|uniref:Cytochrome-ba3 oxidase subunit n=1 Tax=Natrialba swarupiae TaxID=2448032 RepID=A0A5D5AYH2_9EURY|nr:cytochrome-ba3 oxidase subunit [Natrialba swarupiae]TYT63941.1 cytochrome-ba3 oxidase subunit [Natrialba swarupiae]